MKSCLFFSIIILFNTGVMQAQNATTPPTATTTMNTKFKVFGNCGMCEKRIEKAAKIDGVYSADWDVDTKILTVTFDGKQVKPSAIHQAVAAVGHDTDKVKADDAVYANLHACCQYERAQ